MFFLYQILISILLIFSPLIISFRILKGKEDKKRFKEKFCFPSKKRVTGNLIWFHGSSVGELLSILPLVYELEKNQSIKQILITSSTLSSAEIFKKSKFRKTIHQFFPIDSILYSYKFLNYWKPTIAIFVESEIWPSIFKVLNKKNTPLLLLNARVTKKTFNKWNYIKNFSNSVFKNISKAYPQNSETLNYLKKLNVSKIKIMGNLKFINNEQDKLIKLDATLLKNLKNRKIWCASSTHLGEEIICSKVHLSLKKKYSTATFILYLWDSLENNVSLERNIKLFDRCFSFDRFDVKKYDLKYRPLFFGNGFKLRSMQQFKFALSFLGTVHSDRYLVVSRTLSMLPAHLVSYSYFFLQAPWVFYIRRWLTSAFSGSKVEDFNFLPMSKSNVQDVFKNSFAIFDIELKS